MEQLRVAPKRQLHKSIPIVLRVMGVGVTVLMLVSLILYGLSIYYESQVLKLGRETRSLQEENNDLHIHLDRLRSFQKVADASSKIQGLKTASEIIDVAQGGKRYHSSQQAPQSSPPQEAYGY